VDLMNLGRRLAVFLGLALAAGTAWPQGGAAAYDPMATSSAARPEPLDLTVHDASRQRDVPVRVYLPAGNGPAPVVLFSHGLGGTREGYAYLGEHWSAHGLVTVALQHPGSDDTVWKGAAPAQRMAAMRAAASVQNAVLRLKDVPAVLDQLARWNQTPGHPLAGRLDLAHVGMSGHSFGAITTQGVSGQADLSGRASFADGRIKAAIAMSPSSPPPERNPAPFSQVAIPWLLMTGTHDQGVVGEATPASRQAVFPALPPGGKYELVLQGAEHSAFSDRALPGDSQPRNPNHHKAILALSTAFWDAYLRGDAGARTWLDGSGAAGALQAGDRWQRK
jgi:predicted dienelactone hydrolase